MTWNEFIYFAIPTILLFLSAAGIIYKKGKENLAQWLMTLGILIFGAFIVCLWIGQERPPMRTIGETRLWYSFFIALIGLITYKKWKYSWLLSFAGVLATVFVCINIFKPEIHSKNLMPALQSYWFVPHVTVYMLSYAMFAAATIASIIQLNKVKKNKIDNQLYDFIDNIVYIGFGFLMLGLLMGAVWAKEAWGHYWSWDPKETWAFITCAGYLTYIHMRLQNKHIKMTLWTLPISFILLMITWIGVNYLPTAANSVHTYTN